MTEDWRLYEMLTKADWRPGNEPPIQAFILVEFEGKEIKIPVPKSAIVQVKRLP